MKRVVLSAMVLSLMFVFCGAAGAVTYKPVLNFTDWTDDPWGDGIPVSLTPKGSTVVVKADGSGGETWGGIYKKAKGALGMMATINVSRAVTESNGGNVQVGIMNSLGRIKGQRIQARIYVNQWSGQTSIRWEVRQKNDTTGATTTLAVGLLGGWSEAWKTGKDVTVSFRRVGNEIWFNVKGVPSTVKWQPTAPMTALDWSPEIYGYAPNGQNEITAAVKKVSVIYP